MKTEQDYLEYLKKIEQIAREEGCDSLNEIYTEHLRCRFFCQDVVIAKSENVCLREIKETDLEAFYSFSDAQTEPVLKAFLKETREESEIYLRDYITHMYPMFDYGIWTAERTCDGKIIGLCGLGRVVIDGMECTDLGYYICPECRNRGFAGECIEMALDYAKNYLEIPRIYAVIGEENKISGKVLHKFGFQYQKGYEESGGKLLIFQKNLQKKPEK